MRMTVLARHEYLELNVLRDSLAEWVADPEQNGAQRHNAITRASQALERHVNESLPPGTRWVPSVGGICGPAGTSLPNGTDGTFARWFRERLDEVALAERALQPLRQTPDPAPRPTASSYDDTLHALAGIHQQYFTDDRDLRFWKIVLDAALYTGHTVPTELADAEAAIYRVRLGLPNTSDGQIDFVRRAMWADPQ